jgi:uncharacterized membrane protein
MNFSNRTIKKRNSAGIINIITVFILLFIILINFALPILATASGARAKADIYDFILDSSVVSQTTVGQEPVDYFINIINTGNRQDTFSFYTTIISVTNCTEPNKDDWTVSLDKPIVSLEPSHTEVVKLTVKSSCDCQLNCLVTIELKGVSNGNPAVNNSILTYTTHGKGSPRTGLIVEIDYDPLINKVSLDSSMTIDVSVWNLLVQPKSESILMWVNRPHGWDATLSPSEFNLNPRSRRTVTLNLQIPKDVPSDEYTVTVTAQSRDSADIKGRDSIILQIKPDIIVSDVTFSKSEIHDGDKVKLKIGVENIGSGAGANISVVVYDSNDLTSAQELARRVIPVLEPNQMQNLDVTWNAKKGDYNLTIRIDPEVELDELNSKNNMRIEPVSVGAAQDDSATVFISYVFLPILIVIIICVILYYIYSRRKIDAPPSRPRESREPRTTRAREQPHPKRRSGRSRKK